MMESVRAESRDRARSTQIGIARELRWKPGAAVPELTMDGGPRIRAGLGDPGFSGLHHPAFCNPLPAARDGPLTDGAASEQRQIDLICMPQLTSFRETIAAPIGGSRTTTVTSDRHGVRLASQSANEPSPAE